MTDTKPEIEKMYFEMFMKRSGEERFMMGIEMFEVARKIVISSFPEGLSNSEFKERLFLRFYGEDFNENERKKIIEYLKKHS